jgi:hypothetical protein
MNPSPYIHLQNIGSRGTDYFKHYFIPHEGNYHRPKILRYRWLRGFTVALILVKVTVTGFLFLSYPNQAQFASITSDQIVNLTNAERQKSGLGTLASNGKLQNAALNKANDMAAKGYFDHTSPDGRRPWDWVASAGYAYVYAGENLAKDFTSAQSTMKALMNSASHRKNILNDKYTEVGVAVIDATFDGRPTTLMVQLFGSTAGTSIAKAEPVKPAQQPVVDKPAVTNPEPVKPAPVAQPVPTYTARVLQQSQDLVQLASGVETTIWAEFENTGTATWRSEGANFIALNVTDPAGRHSPFQHPSWSEYYRAGVMSATEVKPGAAVKIEWPIMAPNTPGSYQEHYALVAENLTWISGSEINIPIVVSVPVVASGQVNGSATTLMANSISTTSIIPADAFSQPNSDFTAMLVRYANYFYLAIFVLLSLALLLTVFIRIRIQHGPTLFRAALVIVLAGLLYLTHFHFLDTLGNSVKLF